MPRPTTPRLTAYTAQLPDVSDPSTWATRTPLFWNWVTGPGYENMADALAYSENAIDYIDTALAGSETVVDAVAALQPPVEALQAQIAGRNLIINGSGRINQRRYVSGTATTGFREYTLDRWRVMSRGQSLTFTGDDSGRTMTAPSGGVEQLIEGANIVGGTYVISFTGTANCTVGSEPRRSGDTITLPANTDVRVRFASGTFTDVQIELGSVATPFERRHLGVEMALCQRYYEVTQVSAKGRASGGLGASMAATVYYAEKRARPSTLFSPQGLSSNVGSTTLIYQRTNSAIFEVEANTDGEFYIYNEIIVDAEL